MIKAFKIISFAILGFCVLIAILKPELRLLFLLDAGIWALVIHAIYCYER
jgi:hypothetical protein